MATPKAQFSFGWDFSPRVLSTGIWDEIRLVQAGGAYLADVHVQTEPLAETRPRAGPVAAGAPSRAVWPRGPAARVELTDAEGERVALTQEVFDLPEREDVELAFDSAPVARWWPWDQGEPHLYRLTVRVLDERGIANEVEIPAGVRTVRRERFPNGRPWRFTVNGRHIFLRGANWVPADILPGRVTGEDYARLVGQARDAGVNFLRVWGGGIREKRAFWDECDRLGMVAMQEFPLACAFLDHYPRDPGYLAAAGVAKRKGSCGGCGTTRASWRGAVETKSARNVSGCRCVL